MIDRRKAVQQAIVQGEIAHGYLFISPTQTAREKSIQEVAQQLFCVQSEKGVACEACTYCKAVQLNLEHCATVVRPEKGKRHIGIGTLKNVLGRAQLRGINGRSVIVIHDVSLLTPEATATLLKILEEPIQGLVFLFGAPSVESVLPTIRSRSELHFLDKAEEEESVVPTTFAEALELREKYAKDRDGAAKLLAALIVRAEQLVQTTATEGHARLLFCLKELSLMHDELQHTSTHVGLALDRGLFACNGVLFENRS